MKHLLPGVLTALLILTVLTGPVSALEPGGEYAIPEIHIQAAPEVSEGGVTFVPLRTFLDSLGVYYSLEWNQRERRAFVNAWGLSLSVGEGDRYLNANDRCLYLYGTCYLLNDRLMVPLQPLAQACGVEAEWDEKTRELRLEGQYRPISSGEEFYDEADLYWLSRIIYAEAGIESFDGQVAVGNVVLNRKARQYWPDSIYDVIFDDRCGVQFTPTVTGSIYEEPSSTAVIAAKMALEGTDIVGDSCYFLNPDVADERWFEENCEYVATVGSHRFYSGGLW